MGKFVHGNVRGTICGKYLYFYIDKCRDISFYISLQHLLFVHYLFTYEIISLCRVKGFNFLYVQQI